ncbi:T9SS type A sorting domain-containing protein [Viscerimonas tarda]
MNFTNSATDYACSNSSDIKLDLENHSFWGGASYNIQCKNENATWVNVASSSDEIPYMILSYADFLNKPGLDPHKKMYFRTRAPLLDGQYSTSTSTKGLYFLPQFEFPAGKTVIVEPPTCTGDNTVIKIPTKDNINYTLTVSGVNEWSNGSNPNVLDCQKQIISGTTYYCVPTNLEPGNYSLTIEYKLGGGTPCPTSANFTIPSIPAFELKSPIYPQAVSGYKVPENGGTGQVSFSVLNSRDQTVTLNAGTYSAQGVLDSSTEVSGITYYSGTVTIDLPAGEYTNVSVDNASGCHAYYSTITLNQPAPISFTATPIAPKCNTTNLVNGATDNTTGGITLSDIVGGISKYTYKVDGNIVETTTPSGLSTGEHTITISDAYGNTSSQNITINQPPAIIVTPSGLVAPSSGCIPDGQVTLSVSNGLAPYKYGKKPTDIDFGNSNTLTGFYSGDTTVYVKDDCGCVVYKQVTIPPAPLSVDTISSQVISPTCPGGDDGVVIFTLKNITGALSVPGKPTLSSQVEITGNVVRISGLEKGEQYCMIYDTNNGVSCELPLNFVIPDKAPIEITANSIPVGNKGSATGVINGSVSGGNSGNYTVSLYEKDINASLQSQTTASTYSFTGLVGSSAGKIYTVKVVDAQGCETTTDVQVFEPNAVLQLSATLTRPVSCYNESDAQVTIEAVDGWGGYEYSQDNFSWGANTIFDNLPAGDYTFYVKDANNGAHSVAITINQPLPLTITLDSIASVLCYGAETGLLRYRVSGGTYPYALTSLIGTVTYDITANDTLITIRNLSANNYTFTVNDSRNCSATSTQATIAQPTQLQLTVSDTVHTSCELPNGILKAQASGGVAPYKYDLSVAGLGNPILQTQTLDAGNTVIFNDLPAATYRITVTDANNCSTSSELLIIKPYTNPFVSGVTLRDVACFGENNGQITVTASTTSAHSVQTYTLHNNAGYNESNTTGVFENLFAGSYQIDVFDTNGCRSKLPYPVSIKEPQVLVVTVDTIVAVAAKGTNEGQIVFKITGGNEGSKTVQLLNSRNAVVGSLSGINNRSLSFSVGAGSYQIAVTDAKGCRFTTGVLQVSEPETALQLIVKNVEDALCKSQTGSITVAATGGWGGYRYKRGIEQQFSAIRQYNNLYPGSYVITVTDSRGATHSETITVNEPQDSLKAEVIAKQLPTCGNSGSLSIRLSGGTAPYKLFNPDKTDSIAANQALTVEWPNLETGNQLFYLIDANGCRFDLETILPDTALLSIKDMHVTYPNLSGASNASIQAEVQGGVLPYTYLWKKNFTTDITDNTALLGNLTSGYYSLKVTDAAGCSAEQQLYLNDPGDGQLILVETGHETSLNAANGTAVLTAENSETFVQYELISPQQTLKTYLATASDNQFVVRNDTVFLSNLESGNWFLSGVDAAGKRSVAEWTIQAYPAFIFTATRVNHVTQPGGTNGTVQVEVQGGGGNNRFIWTDTATGQILASTDDERNSWLTDLPAGIYKLQALDCYGNSITQNIEVLEPEEALTLSIGEQQNQTCKDNQDAYVILSAKGGWGDYQFRHQTQSYFNNDSIYSQLTTGEHLFYLVDKRGTIDSLKVTVSEPEYVQAVVARVDSVTCKGTVDGKVQFTITGGTAPYFFMDTEVNTWKQGNEAAGLIAGSHTFLFKDSNDCQAQRTVTVNVPEPDSLLFETIKVTHTTCNEDNGKIAVQLKGGTRPYNYRWVNADGQTIGADSIIENLLQNGVYRLYVEDAKGCTQYLEQQIQPSTIPSILKVETTNVLCYGESNGTARVSLVEPATPFAPYTLIWSNGDTGDLSNHFAAGQHSVTILDENGCSSIYYFDIYEPDSLRLRFTDVKEPHCFGYSDGYIRTESLGGAGNYSYLWSTGATIAHIDSVPKGDYWVRVTDGNGCTYEKHITLNEPEYQIVDLGEDIWMCPGNTVVIDGHNYSAYRWFTEEKEIISDERYLRVSEEGHYFLEATNSEGCPVWGDISVFIGNNALIADLLLPSEAFVGDTLIVLEISNMALDSLTWKYDHSVFERLELPEEYRDLPYALALNCLKTGIYNIELLAYSGGCISPAVKQVEIMIGEGRDPDDNWGSVEALLKMVNQFPNPSKGIFTVDIELRDEADVNLTLFEVTSGICVDRRMVTGAKEYKLDYDLPQLNTGVYVLIVTAGNERRQIKMIIE